MEGAGRFLVARDMIGLQKCSATNASVLSAQTLKTKEPKNLEKIEAKLWKKIQVVSFQTIKNNSIYFQLTFQDIFPVC